MTPGVSGFRALLTCFSLWTQCSFGNGALGTIASWAPPQSHDAAREDCGIGTQVDGFRRAFIMVVEDRYGDRRILN